MDTTRHDLTIPEDMQGRRLDQVLAELLPDYSRSRIKDWILAGQVQLDGAAVAPRTRVEAGQQVAVTAVLDIRTADSPESMSLDVVHADDDLVVINKPAGVVVHPGAGNPAGTLVNGLLHRWPELAALPRGGLLHRLDKDTSGLLVVARSLPAHTRLVQALQEREITREYRAICMGRLTAGGSIDAPVGRHPVNRTRMAVVRSGREAVTHYRVLRRFDWHTLIAVRLETGRTHQIRVHMAHERHPLVGDSVYGGRERIPAGAGEQLTAALRGIGRQALHASRLVLQHPIDGRELEFHAPLPADMLDLLCSLSPATRRTEFDTLTWPVPHSR